MLQEFAHKMVELDKGKVTGHELVEFDAHRFLEVVGETHTVLELRKKLTQMDIDNNKRVALLVSNLSFSFRVLKCIAICLAIVL